MLMMRVNKRNVFPGLSEGGEDDEEDELGNLLVDARREIVSIFLFTFLSSSKCGFDLNNKDHNLSLVSA